MKETLLCLTVLTLLFAAGTPALAQRAINRGFHAVPAAKKVIIDGKLDEWDTSGAITSCKDVSDLLDIESCRVAAMYDDENLYLSFVFRDPTPMVNKIDPRMYVSSPRSTKSPVPTTPNPAKKAMYHFLPPV